MAKITASGAPPEFASRAVRTYPTPTGLFSTEIKQEARQESIHRKRLFAVALPRHQAIHEAPALERSEQLRAVADDVNRDVARPGSVPGLVDGFVACIACPPETWDANGAQHTPRNPCIDAVTRWTANGSRVGSYCGSSP